MKQSSMIPGTRIVSEHKTQGHVDGVLAIDWVMANASFPFGETVKASDHFHRITSRIYELEQKLDSMIVVLRDYQDADDDGEVA
jgi:hypothetical protein